MTNKARVLLMAVMIGGASLGCVDVPLEFNPIDPIPYFDSSIDPGVDAAGTDAGTDSGPPPSCPMSLDPSETEPNDESASASPLGTATAPGFCVTGTISCGNDGKEFLHDPDWFELRVDAEVIATFALSWAWDGVTDMDFILFDEGFLLWDGQTSKGEPVAEPLIDFESGSDTPETGSANLVPEEDYWLRVICWDGTDEEKEYALSAIW